MNETDRHNLETRFDGDDEVLDYFETEVVLNTPRLRSIAPLLNLEALAHAAGLEADALTGKLEKNLPLSAAESVALVQTLKRYHLATVA